MLPTDGSFMVGGESPPPPAPSSHGTCSSAGVVVQVGPGSNSSSNSAISTPTSLLTSPAGTPPTPAPSSTSTTFQNLFGVIQQQQQNSDSITPTTPGFASFPAFSSNVTLTSNHVRVGSQDAAFVPNSPSTNITLPVIPSGNAPIGLAPLAILSSPSLGSTPTSPFASPISANHPTDNTCNAGGTVSIDVAATGVSLSSTPQMQTTLPSVASSTSSCIISSSTTTSHINSNAINPTTCSLNQSIAAGGIIGVSSSPQQPHAPQHCLLVSCNSPSLISTEAQADNNTLEQTTAPSTSSTIAIAPPPRSREHRKRERRERRGRDRSHRASSSSNGPVNTSGHHHRSTGDRGGSSSGQGHSSSSSYYNHHGSNSRHHHHHHHRNGVKISSGGVPSNNYNSGNANCMNGAVIVQQPTNNSINNFSGSASAYGGITPNDPSTLLEDQCIISEVHSERGTIRGGDDRLSSVASPVPTESGATLNLGPPPSGSPLGGMSDVLDNHFPPAPPPYSTLPHHHGVGMSVVAAMQAPPPPMAAPVPIPLIPSPVPVSLMPPPPPPTLISPANCIPAQPVRYHFTTAAAAAAGVRASRRSMRAHRGVPYASEEEPKTCCGMSASQAVSIRWFIIVIAVIGICCTLAGTALGAARSAGKEHLTLSLLMIGVGVLLLTVSAVAWRLTANESGTSCRAMLGFARSGSSRGDGGAEPNRRFVPRLPPSYGRPHHPYAAMMYPEFQYRAPPPSYQASMQEYRLRLLLLERSNPTLAALGSQAVGHGHMTMLPPPPYRPYSANMRMLPQARLDVDYSRPPSYRSRSSGGNATSGEYGADAPGSRPSMDPNIGHNHHHHNHHHAHIIESPMHSRDPSLLSYLSQQSVDNMSVVSGHHGNPTATTATVVTVVQAVSVGMDIGLGSTLGPPYDGDEDGKGLASLEAVDDKSCYDPVDDSGHKDGNLVRIVQTTDSSQVIGRDSVIVTVSGGGGSNASLWDTYHHHHLSGPATTYAAITAGPTSVNNNNTTTNNNNNNTSSSAVAPSSSSTPNDRDQQGGNSSGGNGTSEVQILAHL